MLQATVFRSFVGMNIYGMITSIFIWYSLYYATRDRQVLACQSAPLILGCCQHDYLFVHKFIDVQQLRPLGQSELLTLLQQHRFQLIQVDLQGLNKFDQY